MWREQGPQQAKREEDTGRDCCSPQGDGIQNLWPVAVRNNALSSMVQDRRKPIIHQIRPWKNVLGRVAIAVMKLCDQSNLRSVVFE